MSLSCRLYVDYFWLKPVIKDSKSGAMGTDFVEMPVLVKQVFFWRDCVVEISRRGLFGLMQTLVGASAFQAGMKASAKDSRTALWARCWLHDERVPSVAVFEDHALCFGCKTVFRDSADVERFRTSAWMRAETVRADEQLGDILTGKSPWPRERDRAWAFYPRA